MTEAEWSDCTSPDLMLQHLQRKASARKLRLFACGCCRTVWRWLKRKELRQAVEASESFIEGLISQKELTAVERRSQELLHGLEFEAHTYMRKKAYLARDVALVVRIAVSAQMTWVDASRAAAAVQDVFTWLPYLLKDQGSLVREIFGNPFRPVVADPAWLTWNSGTVVHMAQTIYEKRQFDGLPILADALEEAGCTNADILEHCRKKDAHVRGCWVVDVILRKK